MKGPDSSGPFSLMNFSCAWGIHLANRLLGLPGSSENKLQKNEPSAKFTQTLGQPCVKDMSSPG